MPAGQLGGFKAPPEIKPSDMATASSGGGMLSQASGPGTNTGGFQNPRFDLPEVQNQIDPNAVTAPAPVQSQVTTIEPPEDIDAAQIGEYTPYQEVLGEVAPESTVEGRLPGLLSQNNPYIERARTRAAAMSNRRGMLNTSMAMGAAEGAAIDRALPIAQQDARANLEQQFLNQGYSNDAARYLAEQSVQRQNLQAGLEQQTREGNVARGFEAARLDQEAENRSAMMFAEEQNKQSFAQLSADLQGQLKMLDNDLAMRLDSLQREYSLLQNLDSVRGSIYKQMIAGMSTILANEDKASVANSKINALLQKAGVEMAFSDGVVGGLGKGEAWEEPKPKKTTSTKKSSSGGGDKKNPNAGTGTYNFTTRSDRGGDGRTGSGTSSYGGGRSGGMPSGGSGTGGAPSTSRAGGI